MCVTPEGERLERLIEHDRARWQMVTAAILLIAASCTTPDFAVPDTSVADEVEIAALSKAVNGANRTMEAHSMAQREEEMSNVAEVPDVLRLTRMGERSIRYQVNLWEPYRVEIYNSRSQLLWSIASQGTPCDMYHSDSSLEMEYVFVVTWNGYVLKKTTTLEEGGS